MAPKKDPSGYIWLAASLRSLIERLNEDSSRAFELELVKQSAQLTNAAVEIANVYSELIKLASPTLSKRTNDVPF